MSETVIQKAMIEYLRLNTETPIEALREMTQATATLIETAAFGAYMHAVKQGDKRTKLNTLRKSLYHLVDDYLEQAKEEYAREQRSN